MPIEIQRATLFQQMNMRNGDDSVIEEPSSGKKVAISESSFISSSNAE